jgi:PAP2 superfamily C-terminal
MSWQHIVQARRQIAWVLALRYLCFVVMCALALVHERERGPTLYDPLLAWIPYQPWVDRINWVLWLVAYLPLACVLLWTDTQRWLRYMISGAWVTLARGVCILATHLGPPNPEHCGPGIGERDYGTALLALVSPYHIFVESSQRAYLTQDLFFSGHTATTFLLWLYLRDRGAWGWLALLAHWIVVASVLAAHLHYTIDILGAWAVTYSIYALRERRWSA